MLVVSIKTHLPPALDELKFWITYQSTSLVSKLFLAFQEITSVDLRSWDS